MKYSKLIIGVVIIIVIIALILNFNIIFTPSEEKMNDPEAKIEIEKVVSGELVINQGEFIYFSAINSTDKDGKIDNYFWDFDDGNSSDSVDPVHTYDTPGVYDVTLTVTDNDGNKNVTSIRITVINNQPVANINIQHPVYSINPEIPIFYNIQFNSTGSMDSDGTLTAWHWDFGDGNSSTEPNPRHRFDNTGQFFVTLKVFDDDGDFAEDSFEIEIILRTYKIEWNLEQIENVIEPNGYTLEGQSTEILDQLDQEQIASIDVILNWTDRQPFLKDNQTEGEDSLELNILTPENITRIENSSSGQISIIIDYIPSLSDKNYQAKTANDAIDNAINDAGFSNEGVGEWYFNVTALECKGGSWTDEIFDLDVGNFWDLKIIIYYFSFEITDVSYE
jgi:PKD repeat protein